MRWLRLVSIGAVFLAASCGLGLSYPDFSAKQYRLEGRRALPGYDVSGPATFYRDGERLRYEGVLEDRGISTVIYDPARNAAFLLDSASSSRRRQFAGAPPQRLAVRLDTGAIPQPLEMTWAALGEDNVRAIGRCRVAGERGGLWRPRRPIAEDIERTACITRDGIVLRLTENNVTLFEATSLERGAQPLSLFEIPEAYRIVDDAELARTDAPSGG